MIIIPAIDLKSGKCVRLEQGLADRETVYAEDPAKMARAWESAGGEFLHVVDLDGAFSGKRCHTDVVRSIVEAVQMPVELGGGIRTDEDIRVTLECGVERVIIGTRAIEDLEALIFPEAPHRIYAHIFRANLFLFSRLHPQQNLLLDSRCLTVF